MTLDWPASDDELLAMARARSGRARKSSEAASIYTDDEASPTPPVYIPGTRKSSRMVNPIARRRFAGITLIIPLKHCVSDNAKHAALDVRTRSGEKKARLVLTAPYRQAKETIGAIARRAMEGIEPTMQPVNLRGVVYFENNRRDLQNSSKLVCDALSGIVYRDDKQIVDAHWVRAENDKNSPRIEVTVRAALTPIPQESR